MVRREGKPLEPFREALWRDITPEAMHDTHTGICQVEARDMGSAITERDECGKRNA